jgi:hypothetical protein
LRGAPGIDLRRAVFHRAFSARPLLNRFLGSAPPQALTRSPRKHRVDPNIPIEDAVGAMSELVRAGNDVIPIPGTKRVRNLEDNMGALAVQLTESDLEETEARFRQFAVAGERYRPEMMALVHG